MNITHVRAEEIQDSRGRATLRVHVAAETGEGMCDVPSGASTGSAEAHELRDHDGSMGLAIAAINGEIARHIIGMDVREQSKIDHALIGLDGTPDKSRLGGNSLIGVSIAAAKAAASAQGIQLFAHLRTLETIEVSRAVPYLVINLFNGGKHAAMGTPFQEHQIIPQTESIQEALEIAQRVQFMLGDLMSARGSSISEGDEGGISAVVDSVIEPFAYLHEAVVEAGMEHKVVLGADIAASSIEYENGTYRVLGVEKTPENLTELYLSLKKEYNLTHIEDPFMETDARSFANLLAKDSSLMVIGDDLTATNAGRIKASADAKAINAVIIKPNQVGTVTETLAAMKAARERGIHCIVSHRSGETMDDFVADFAFAFGAYGLKAGAPHRPERRVKYDRLMELTYGK